MKVSTCNILMTFLKNAKDQTQHPQNIAAIATSIAATRFTPHPLPNVMKLIYKVNDL